MIEKVEGIILNEQDYSESSKILNILTKEYGIIGAIAKGSRSLKSDLRTTTEKLTYGHFHIYYKPNKLSVLTAVDVINNFKVLKKDIEKISYSFFLLELTKQVATQNNDSDIYEILKATLIKINEGLDPQILTNILELKYLKYLGIAPILDKCVNCGTQKEIATLSIIKGGYLCKKCLKNEAIINEQTIKMIRILYYVEINRIAKLDVNAQIKKEINQLIDEYYDTYAGLYLKSKDFLKQIS